MSARYSLSPMQHGMLFHFLSGQQAGTDIEQIVCTLDEEVNAPALRRAWQEVVGRHAALRTHFHWQGMAEPMQEVDDEIPLAYQEHDWRKWSPAEQTQRLEAFLRKDRKAGFNLGQAPLTRWTLLQLEDASYRLIWTFHHALLDGRSFYFVLKEAFSLYDALRGGTPPELETPRPYQDHIAWLENQNWAEAEGFWRRALKGFTNPTPLVVDRTTSEPLQLSPDSHTEEQIRLSQKLTEDLRELAKEYEVTLNNIIQAAWAVLLSRYCGEEDVLFGATRACRRSSVPGSESMVGLLVNTLPVRARVGSETPLPVCLKELRAQQLAIRTYEHTPLVYVQGWSEVPKGKPLFESILVFENFSFSNALRSLGGEWTKREFHLREQTVYPITVYAFAEAELMVKIAFDLNRFDPETIRRMLGHLHTLLEGMAAKPTERLAYLPLLTEEEREELLVRWNQSQTASQSNNCIHEAIERQVERPSKLWPHHFNLFLSLCYDLSEVVLFLR